MSLFRFVLLLILSAASVEAIAQNFSLPSCFPKTIWTPAGTGSDWVTGREPKVSPTGATIVWRGMWCPDGKGGWNAYVHRCVEGRTCLDAVALESELHTAVRTPNPLEALKTAIAKYQSPPLANEKEDWYFAGVKALEELKKIKPVVATFRVKKNFFCSAEPCTRPVFSLVNGTRDTKEIGRALVGQACKVDRPTLASGDDLWAEFGPDFKPQQVALCSRD